MCVKTHSIFPYIYIMRKEKFLKIKHSVLKLLNFQKDDIIIKRKPNFLTKRI